MVHGCDVVGNLSVSLSTVMTAPANNGMTGTMSVIKNTEEVQKYVHIWHGGA